MSEDMRGLFFIMKGQYKKGVEPSYINTNGGVSYIGGYDPYYTSEEWFMLIDTRTFQCHSSSSSLHKVLKSAYNIIVRNKGNAKRYFKAISDVPYGVSKSMRELREHVYEEFGHYFSDEIKEMEDLAYEVVKEEKPLNKARKLVSKNKTKIGLVTTPSKKEMVMETPTPKMVKPKVKMGVKRLTME